MQAIHAENVNWKSKSRGVREAKVFSTYHGSEETRIDIVEVPAGGYIPPHRHSSRREFITILLSAGAQLQVGDRVFRPIAGQVFHREPEDILALTNDSHHPFRYSVVSFGYEASDIEWLNEADADLLEDQKAAHLAARGAKTEGQAKAKPVEKQDEEQSDDSSEAEAKVEKVEKTAEKDESEKSEEDESGNAKDKKKSKSEKSGKKSKKKPKKKK